MAIGFTTKEEFSKAINGLWIEVEEGFITLLNDINTVKEEFSAQIKEEVSKPKDEEIAALKEEISFLKEEVVNLHNEIGPLKDQVKRFEEQLTAYREPNRLIERLKGKVLKEKEDN